MELLFKDQQGNDGSNVNALLLEVSLYNLQLYLEDCT